jgi:hypothetical protein
MSVLLLAAAVVFALALLFVLFLTADAAALAPALRRAGPVALLLAGGALLVAGLEVAGGILVAAAAAWCGLLLRDGGGRRKPKPRRRSTVRTAALEMELDHRTGRLEGIVLAGRQEGKTLGAMPRRALLELRREIAADPESRQLIEAYLDSRFPVWRGNPDANMRGRLCGAPRAGAMTKQEAYQILGLEAGAGTAEIRQAHRRLMQRVHADIGGASFLAARIDEAKDVLLSDHG